MHLGGQQGIRRKKLLHGARRLRHCATSPAHPAHVAHPSGLPAAMAVLRLLRAFTPLATLWVGKLIIDAVVAVREASLDLSRLWQLVALEIVIVLVGEMLARASALVESLLGDLFSNSTNMRLMEHAATLDLYHFEDPTFYDRLERARRQTTNRIGLLAQLLTMGQDVLTLLSLGAALFVYSPWLLLVLPWPSCPASSARRTSPRSSTRSSPVGHQSGGSSTICGTSAPATRRRRKCTCSDSRPGSSGAIVDSRSASTRRTSGCQCARAVSRPRCRSWGRWATTRPMSSSSCVPCMGALRSAR